MINMAFALGSLCCLALVRLCYGACNFPADLLGDWYSTSYGTLTFNSTSFTGFTSGLSLTSLDFTCFESSGSQYVASSSYDVLSQVSITVYLCMDLTKISTVKYVLTLDGNLDEYSGVRVYSSAASTVTMDEVCARSDNRSSGEYDLLIKADSVSSAFTSCPGGLQSLFNVDIDSSAIVNCSNSTLDGRTSAWLVFNYSSCASGILNSGGLLQCLYSTTLDYTYVTLYNNDTNVDEISTFRFTCMVVSKDGAILKATEYPKSCHTWQTPTSVDPPGITYYMEDKLYQEKKNTDYTIVIIVVCVIIVILMIAIIIIILYLKVFRKSQEAPKAKKRIKKKPSVTEYTPRSLGHASSAEKVDHVINKQSTGEVLTGLMNGNKNKAVVGDMYEPPKKAAWQKKWEKSPRWDDSLSHSKKYPSTGSVAIDIPLMELDKAYTLSSSLPESIDIPFASSPCPRANHNCQKDQTAEQREDVTSTRANVLPRSHASPKIPESTGKFGDSQTSPVSVEPPLPLLEKRLDTITENPLSRENTSSRISNKTGHSKRLQLYPDSNRLSSREMSVYTLRPFTRSTASVGDIRLQNSLQNVSRISHLSASNASIFDDPTWLVENLKPPEETLQTFKNLIPGLPKQKDSKWFLKAPKVTSDAREDLNYLKYRARPIGVGLNNTDDFGLTKSTSLEIINRAKKQRRNKHKKDKAWQQKWEITMRPKTPPPFATRKRSKSPVKLFQNTFNFSIDPVMQNPETQDIAHETPNESDSPRVSLSEIKKETEEGLSTVQIDVQPGLPVYNIAGDTKQDRKIKQVAILGEVIHDAENNRGNFEETVPPDNLSMNSYLDERVVETTSNKTELSQVPYSKEKENSFETVSLHSLVFYPENWIYYDESNDDDIWRLGAQSVIGKSKRELKQFMHIENESVQKTGIATINYAKMALKEKRGKRKRISYVSIN